MNGNGSVVTVETPDGQMEVFIALGDSDKPAACAILYMDVFGLREELFDLARAFAAEGCSAAVPDLFHHLPGSRFPPANGREDRPSADALHANAVTTIRMSQADSRALMGWLDTGSAGILPASYFAIGYCMGGRHALAAAAAMPERIGGGVSVHGGRLVTEGAASPHHLVSSLTVPFHFACARDDPTCPAEHCDILRQEAADATARVTLEILNAHHGWSFPTRWSYDPAAAAHVHKLACAMMMAGTT